MMKAFPAFLTLFFSANFLAAQPQNWQSRGIGGGGALFFPSLSPHDTAEFFITCDMADYFHSTTRGESWFIPDWRELVSTSRGKIQFTEDPDVLYGLDSRNDLTTPAKSFDGGITWTPLDDDPTGGGADALIVDFENQNRLFVTNYDELFYSADGGATFNSIYSDATGNGVHLAGVFFDNDTITVATNGGFLRSINGGSSFSAFTSTGIAAGEVPLSFCGSREGNTARMFVLTANNLDVYQGITGADFGVYQAIYARDSGQNSWTQKTTGINANHFPFFLSMSGGDISTVYASGSNQVNFAPLVLKSSNGGNTWANVFQSVNNQNIYTGWCGHQGDLNWGWAECALGFSVQPNNPLRAIVTDFGFAHLTVDGGATWKQIYTSTEDQHPLNTPTPKWQNYHGIGLENTACWHLFWSDSLTLHTGYSDIIGTRSLDGGESWIKSKVDSNRSNSVNCVYYTMKHSVNGNLYAATSSVHDMYQSTYLTDARIDGGTGHIWYSTNNGNTWAMLHNFGDPVIWLAEDPTNPNRMYASVIHSANGGIFVTNDLQNGTGATWTRVALPPRTQGHPFNVHVLNDGAVVCTYSGRRAGNPQNFTNSSGVFVSTDQGNTWVDRSSAQMIYWTKDLIIDPHDEAQNTWFVAVHRGWGGPPNDLGGLFKTTNRGANWTEVSDLLYAESFAISPLDSNEGYLTTENEGLYICTNLRSANPVFSQVENYPFVRPNRVFYNPYNPSEIWVASFGNGLRMGSDAPALDAVDDLTIEAMSDSVTLRWSPSAGAQSYQIFGGNESGNMNTLLATTADTFFVHSAGNPNYYYHVIAGN